MSDANDKVCDKEKLLELKAEIFDLIEVRGKLEQQAKETGENIARKVQELRELEEEEGIQ